MTPPPALGTPPTPSPESFDDSSDGVPPKQGRRRPRTPMLMVGAVLIVVIAMAAISVIPRLYSAANTAPAQPSTSGLIPVVTYTPAPQATARAVISSGADLGKPVSFRTSSGTGRLTLSRATWTSAGRMAPPAGKQYLVVAVQIECHSGTVAVSPLDLVAGSQPSTGTGFGPALTDPLPGVTLAAGQEAHGEIGFVIAQKATTLAWLNGSRNAVAYSEVPAP